MSSSNAAAIYAVSKDDNILKYKCSNMQVLDNTLKLHRKDKKDFYIFQEVGVKYISRITYFDGKCVYNNKEFWTKTAVEAKLTPETFKEHAVLDFLGNAVTYDRYIDEYNMNLSRLSVLDGLAGEIAYNIEIGNEFISLFREECVKTDFKGITPLQIGIKLAPVISLVQTGSFREAKQVLQTMETDAFLTPERIKKYIDMMDAADAIEYATEEDYYYSM